MKTFTLTIDLENDAFSDEQGGPHSELIDILNKVRNSLQRPEYLSILGQYEDGLSISDSNGNVCGKVKVE